MTRCAQSSNSFLQLVLRQWWRRGETFRRGSRRQGGTLKVLGERGEVSFDQPRRTVAPPLRAGPALDSSPFLEHFHGTDEKRRDEAISDCTAHTKGDRSGAPSGGPRYFNVPASRVPLTILLTWTLGGDRWRGCEVNDTKSPFVRARPSSVRSDERNPGSGFAAQTHEAKVAEAA